MKALKIWSFIMLIAGIAAYLYGAFSGVFNRSASMGILILYGTSPLAHSLSIISIFCILLSISLFFVLYALNEKREK